MFTVIMGALFVFLAVLFLFGGTKLGGKREGCKARRKETACLEGYKASASAFLRAVFFA